nr:uncharacterized protein LOC117686875 [Crassostrea gigas]
MPKTKSRPARPAPTERTSRRPRLHAAARDEPQSVVQAATPQARSSPVEQSAPQATTTSVCTIPVTEPPVPTVGQIQGTGSSSRPATPTHTNILPQRALEDEMNRLLMSSLASNTTKAYAVGLQAFDQFRLNQQLSILWPPPSNHILMFIAHLSIQGCKQTTARAYTSAIAFKCKVLGNGDPTKHFLVGKVLEGMKRQNNNRDVRMPITLEILNQILHKLPVVCQDTYETSLFSAAFTLAYYAFLRVGELALSKGNSPDRIIQVQHISIQHSIINLLIKYTKTDQLGKGTHLRINATY